LLQIKYDLEEFFYDSFDRIENIHAIIAIHFTVNFLCLFARILAGIVIGSYYSIY